MTNENSQKRNQLMVILVGDTRWRPQRFFPQRHGQKRIQNGRGPGEIMERRQGQTFRRE